MQVSSVNNPLLESKGKYLGILGCIQEVSPVLSAAFSGLVPEAYTIIGLERPRS